MKKIYLFIAMGLTLLAGACGHRNNVSVEEEEYVGLTVEDSLRLALANQDSLLSLMNDITADMNAIKQMEDILSAPSSLSTETESARQRIHEDMMAIQNTLQQRRERLAELEKKLRNATSNNATLQKTIETLKAQIADQEQSIAGLTEELSKKNIIIEKLEQTNDSLATTLTAINEAKEAAEEENVRLTDDINTCYYVIGTNKELKDKGLIQTRFLRSTKILPGDVDTQFFVKADRRSLLEINCHSKKAEVMTSQPQSSYNFITEANGDKILVIKDSNEFWKKSDFLVIKID